MKKLLPKFDIGKVHVIKGQTGNDIIDAMIREITADMKFIKITKKPEGIIEISLAVPIPKPPSSGDYVLTAQDGVAQWELIEDCSA